VPSAAFAHDFWLQPQGENLVGSRISLAVHIGDHLSGQQVKRLPGIVDRFVVYCEADPDGAVVAESDNDLYFGYHDVEKACDKTFVLTTNKFNIKLDADAFNSYLEDEGMDQALELRKSLGLLESDAEETYYRIVKTVVGEDDTAGRVFSLPLELSVVPMPEGAASDQLAVLVTEGGKPVPNRQVKARFLSADGQLRRQRTDENGVAVFQIDDSGLWAFATTSMSLAGGVSPRWQSIWSSLTLQLD